MNNNNDEAEPLNEITDHINRHPSLPKDRTSIFKGCNDTSNLLNRVDHPTNF